MTPTDRVRLRRGDVLGAVGAERRCSNASRSASSISQRGRPNGRVAPLIAYSSPAAIHARTLSSLTPSRAATWGGVSFRRRSAGIAVPLPVAAVVTSLRLLLAPDA